MEYVREAKHAKTNANILNTDVVMTSAVEAPISLIALNNRNVGSEVDDYLCRYKKATTK
jgi:hypothetical protein